MKYVQISSARVIRAEEAFAKEAARQGLKQKRCRDTRGNLERSGAVFLKIFFLDQKILANSFSLCYSKEQIR